MSERTIPPASGASAPASPSVAASRAGAPAHDVASLSGQWSVLLAIVLYAVALRPQLVSIGPLAHLIAPDMGMTFAQVGLLITIPLACMGLAALVVATVNARVGARRAMDVSLAVIVVVGLVRAASPGPVALILLTLPIGVAIGLAGATLPVMVKERLASRPATATGVYTTAIQLGSTLAAVLAIPLALAFDGWRGALAAFAFAGLASLGAWVVIMRRHPSPSDGPAAPKASGGRSRLRWRDPVAWLLAILFWLSAFPFYGLVAWLASAYVELGWSDVNAGTLVGLVGLAGMPASLAVGWAADRAGSRRAYLVGCSLLLIVGLTGLVVAPGLAVPCAILAGAMLGAVFTLALMLPLDLAVSPAVAAGLVGVELAGGYLLVAMTPALLGAVRDVTGSFSASLWLNVAAAVGLLLISLPLSPARMRRWRERPA